VQDYVTASIVINSVKNDLKCSKLFMKKNLSISSSFICRLAEGGYHIDTLREELSGAVAKAGEKRIISERWIVALGNEAQPVSPTADLFMEFVKIDATSEEAILDFTGRFGFLGELGHALPFQVEPERIVADENAMFFGEPLNFWREQHRQMFEAVDLWRMIKESPEELRKRIKWAKDYSVVTYEGPSRRSPSGIEIPGTSATIADHAENFHRELLKRFDPGDLLMPARVYLQTVLNEKVHAYVPYQYRWVEGFKRLGGGLSPSCLLGYLWFQLGEALADFSSFQHCLICDKLMLIRPKTARHRGLRNDREVCSPRCRTQKWLERKAKAQRLSQEGMSAAKIAAELGSELNVVQGWIKSARQKARAHK
jgi:hypothetical protein